MPDKKLTVSEKIAKWQKENLGEKTYNELQEKAIDQWTREIPIIASRGEIVDRNGKVVFIGSEDTWEDNQ